MPNWIQKLFKPKPQPSAPVSMSAIDYAKWKKEKVDKLVALIAETIALYNATACPCAFPRFRQIVGIDCLDYRAAFCATETEWFIDVAKPFYIQEIVGSPNNNEERWTCKKCNSKWYFNWQDFSISVSRTVLKIQTLHAADVGAAASTPIPLYVGLSGHRFPEQGKIVPVDFDTFKNYIQELA